MKMFGTVLSYTAKLFLLALAPLALFRNFDVLLALMVLFSVLFSFLPVYLAKRKAVEFPLVLDLFITFALIAHNAGVYFHWYSGIKNYDVFSYVLGTVLAGLMAYLVTLGMVNRKRLAIGKVGTIVLAATFALALGALWEIGEYAVDNIFKISAQHGNSDTMNDLTVSLITALVTPLILSFVFRGKTVQEKFVEPIMAMFSIKEKGQKEEIYEGLIKPLKKEEEAVAEEPISNPVIDVQPAVNPLILPEKSLDSLKKIF